jgi:acyl-CoA synthetase (AMP-forming)/AMP-acid ligase II
VPRVFVFPESLPKSAVGKILKRELREDRETIVSNS